MTVNYLYAFKIGNLNIFIVLYLDKKWPNHFEYVEINKTFVDTIGKNCNLKLNSLFC